MRTDAKQQTPILLPKGRRTYVVNAVRETIYRIEADSTEDAIERMIQGEGTETHQESYELSAAPVCPDCDERLTEDRAGWYCETCDRDVEEEA